MFVCLFVVHSLWDVDGITEEKGSWEDLGYGGWKMREEEGLWELRKESLFILINGKRKCYDVDYDRYIGLSPLF
jgi:hypothetical protein